VNDRQRRHRFRGNAERLHRRIEETRAAPGHPLLCSECDRLSIGRASGWTMRLGHDDELYAFCPECDEQEFGGLAG
jgi:hypothetical protein